MSQGGPNISQLFSKYEQKVQLPKFLAIAQAEERGDETTINSLMDTFAGNDEQMFELFVQDLQSIGSYQDSQAAKLEQLKRQLEAKDAEIAALEQKRGAILTKYEDGMGAAVASFRPQQNGHTANHSSANPSNDGSKKRRSGCTIV